MGMLDFFTGGKSGDAEDALRRAERYFSDVKTPTAEELTLPELQKYVEMGIMTPAQAEAYIQERNSFDDQTIDQTGTAAQIQALNQLSEVANAGAEGTPMQQAAIENSLQKVNTNIGGQRGAIEQAMAAKGIPASLISAALQNQTVGQEAQQAHMDAVNASASNYQTALNALSQGGALGGQLQGQQNTQSNTVANAANAMQQFNAQNQQQVGQFNAANQTNANAANAANRQQVSNNNTGLSNARTQYNANVPQQVFQNQMNKAQGQAGAATNVGSLYDKQGQQNAGIMAGLINTGTSFIPSAGTGAGGKGGEQGVDPKTLLAFAAHGGVVEDPMYCADGAIIPGQPEVAGDSLLNDKVPVMASPGEAFLSRETVAENPDVVNSLLSDQNAGSQIDAQDVATLLKALRSIRMGVA